MLIDSIEAFDQAVERLAARPDTPLLCDLETTGLAPFARVNPDRIIGFAIGLLDDPETDCYIPIRHGEGFNLPVDYVLEKLRALFKGRKLVNFNIGFDLRFLWVDGFELPPEIEDLMNAAHLCNEEEPKFALKVIGEKYLGVKAAEADKELKAELKARKLKKGDMWKLPASLIAPYAVQDIRLVRQLRKFYFPILTRWRLMHLYVERCYYRLLLTRVELRGMLLDIEEIQRQRAAIGPRLVEMRQELARMAKEEAGIEDLNPNSSKQVQAWLGLKKTDKAALEEMVERGQDPRALLMLEYRSLQKADSSFFRPLLEMSGADDYVHPNFKVARTVTHRLACGDPNLQQVAKNKKDRKYSVKNCFVAPEGWFVVEADLSQIEPRVAVDFSKDVEMIAAFQAGLDIHIRAAKQIFKVDKVDTETNEGKEMKDGAKALSLGTLYALGALKIAKKLKLKHEKGPDGKYEYHHELVWRVDKASGELTQVACSENDHEFCTAAGKGFQRDYLETWPTLKPCVQAVTRLAEQIGYIRIPLTGAVRRFPNSRFCYKAFNALIQMTAGEILRKALMRFDQEWGRDENDPKLVLTVHDSVVFYVKKGPKALEHVRRIKQIMETTTPLIVPTPSDVKIGPSYGNLGSIDAKLLAYAA